ncbi:MAG: hypothetical protein K2X87_31765 [Gemmataceae bacterium]|nr:hypothetical protein [Gemmataceae bacterium]
MSTAAVLDREEYVEQAYFFRTFRERVADNLAAQDILARVHEEVLSTTRLPLAIQFLATELRHSGLLATGFGKLPHYFTPYQAFVVAQAEDEKQRFSMPTALLVLEREAAYKAGQPTPAGLFVYQFEALARNRMGYVEGLPAMSADPFYDADWKGFIDEVRRQAGVVDFADLVYLRSELYVQDKRRTDREYEPPVPPIFGAKEGKIARASRGRDPLYLFAALQRQLGYPEVPRFNQKDDLATKFEAIAKRLNELETRLRLAEGEQRGNVDLTQFGKPDILKDDSE